jgi:biotin transport system substrate-specific component
MSAERTLTLADAALPHTGTLQNVLLIVGASLLTGLAAQAEIRVPGLVVPITGQTFAVLLTGAVLGARRAFAAQVLYILEGVMGLPVFAGGASGPMVLAGPTAGFLVAFPFAAAATGALAERGWDRRFVSMFLAMLAGSTLIFAGGLAWLSRFVPGDALLSQGLFPFIPGDLIKSSLAALAFPLAWRWARRDGSHG